MDNPPLKNLTSYRLNDLTSSRVAFTMAEILLSLTIIGVVAAITLPSLTGNINERTWNTQRKALYARFSQAIALMPALNGYGTLTGTIDASRSQTVTEDNVAETFITAGLSKVIKVNNICDNTHLTDCGISSTYTTLTGTANQPIPTKMSELNSKMIMADNSTNGPATYDALDTKAAALETQNGESIVLFYNPNCVANMGETKNYFSQPKICVNMIYDLNGTKGPNTVGKDIGFMTILYPTDSVVVAPMPYRSTMGGVASADASSACTTRAGSDYRIPTKDELAALFVNKNLTEVGTTDSHWFSSSKWVSSNGAEIKNWLIVGTNGHYRLPSSSDSEWEVLCVKRD